MTSNSPIYESSSEVFKQQTGKSVEEWRVVLDNWGVAEKGHTRCTIFLEQEHKLGPEWAQAVAVRYQRDKYI